MLNKLRMKLFCSELKEQWIPKQLLIQQNHDVK